MDSGLQNFISQHEWQKQFSGNYSFLSSVYFGYQFIRSFEEVLGFGIDHIIFISRGGCLVAYCIDSQIRDFASDLNKKVEVDISYGYNIADSLTKKADEMYGFIDALLRDEISYEDFKKFVFLQNEYASFHEALKEILNQSSEDVREKLLPCFLKARIHSENVFSRTEELMNVFGKQLGNSIGLPTNLVLSLSDVEVERFFLSREVPERDKLELRLKKYALFFSKNENTYRLFTGEDVGVLEELLTWDTKGKFVTGSVAQSGKVIGKVRIIIDPKDVLDFDVGDVLVASMTRPEFLPLMKKASAFVTDGGGILCHAAIVAREMGKPCVIGTGNATKVFKGGDMVEVDADNGVVRRI